MSLNTNNQDQTEQLLSRVQMAYRERKPLAIQGNGSKLFLIHSLSGQPVSSAFHRGIINYMPSELTVTVRSGTLLSELKKVLAEKGQMLPFEPPAFADNATIGGTIAAGLSGSSRPFSGSVRDFVLGCKVINGRGELMQFGGEVMKNVAGYDLSRLLTGSYGSLGLILEVSLKLLPLAPKVKSLSFTVQSNNFTHKVRELYMAGHPITAACYLDDRSYIRIAGSAEGVNSSFQAMSENLEQQSNPPEEINNSFWTSLDEQQLSFFDHSQPLWRISLPPWTADNFEQYMSRGDRQLIDWGGAQRWFYSNQNADEIRHYAKLQGGHAQLFRANTLSHDELIRIPKQQPLTVQMMKIQQQIKAAMDPHKLFNQGCIYSEL